MPSAGILSFAPTTLFPCSSPASTLGRHRRRAAPPPRVRCPPPSACAAATAGCRAATRSPYEVLCVEASATAAEIKAAYRALAKRLHPDATGAASEGDFIEVRDAYSTLSDPDARAMYDRGAATAAVFVPNPIYPASSGFRGRRWETDQCW